MHDGLARHGARRAILVALLLALLGGALPVAPVAGAATPDTGGQWRAIPQPREARTEHTATTLADGRVLVAGVGSSETFDPATLTWGAPVPMVTRRYQHTATLLRDGRVLVAGATTELYDPATDAWRAGAPRAARARARPRPSCPTAGCWPPGTVPRSTPPCSTAGRRSPRRASNG